MVTAPGVDYSFKQSQRAKIDNIYWKVIQGLYYMLGKRFFYSTCPPK